MHAKRGKPQYSAFPGVGVGMEQDERRRDCSGEGRCSDSGSIGDDVEDRIVIVCPRKGCIMEYKKRPHADSTLDDVASNESQPQQEYSTEVDEQQQVNHRSIKIQCASQPRSRKDPAVCFDGSLRSLPVLLAQRETAAGVRPGVHIIRNGNSNWSDWQRRMLIRPVVSGTRGSYEYRPYTRRSIPFQQLNTPVEQAMIGIDATGSYLLTLGEMEDRSQDSNQQDGFEYYKFLALRLYGVPSPSEVRLRKYRYSSTTGNDDNPPNKSPPILLGTVPLARVPLLDALVSLTARTPTRIWLSRDQGLGVAWVSHFTIDPMPYELHHAITLFSPTDMHMLQRRSCSQASMTSMIPVLRLEQFHVNGVSHPTTQLGVRKVLWNVHVLPSSSSSSSNTTHVDSHDKPPAGYLLLIRQNHEACYRMTWIVSTLTTCQYNIRACYFPQNSMTRSSPAFPIRSDHSMDRTGLLTPITDGCWTIDNGEDPLFTIDLLHHDSEDLRKTTKRTRRDDATLQSGCVRVVKEMWLRLDVILLDQLRRRPNLVVMGRRPNRWSLDNLPPCSFDMVEVLNAGASLQAVICFDCGDETVRAVFVEIDLFTMPQSSSSLHYYREVQWFKRPLKSVSEPLDTIAERLSLNQRMRLQRIGPYQYQYHTAQTETPLRDYTYLCTSKSGLELDDYCDDNDWTTTHVPCSASTITNEPPARKRISYDSIYPDVHIFDNRAVLNYTPVQSFKSRSSPIEVVYG